MIHVLSCEMLGNICLASFIIIIYYLLFLLCILSQTLVIVNLCNGLHQRSQKWTSYCPKRYFSLVGQVTVTWHMCDGWADNNCTSELYSPQTSRHLVSDKCWCMHITCPKDECFSNFTTTSVTCSWCCKPLPKWLMTKFCDSVTSHGLVNYRHQAITWTWAPSQYKDRLSQVWGFPC